MEIKKDYKEFLESLNAQKVEYLIVGAYVLAFFGVPRYTGDLDIYVKPDKENAKRVITSLTTFGFPTKGLSEADFMQADKVIQLGVAPVRIDIVTSITGVSWEEAFSGRRAGNYGDVLVYFLGREQFIANKHSLGRQKDLADIESLEKK